jgi:hypothetical protein
MALPAATGFVRPGDAGCRALDRAGDMRVSPFGPITSCTVSQAGIAGTGNCSLGAPRHSLV